MEATERYALFGSVSSVSEFSALCDPRKIHKKCEECAFIQPPGNQELLASWLLNSPTSDIA